MDIKELKTKIENNTLSNEFMIWVIQDESSNIIVRQYLDKICSNKQLSIKFIEKINEIPDDSFIEDTNLYVINCDRYEDKLTHDNCIIVCKHGDGVKIPKLEDWQIIDYSLNKVKGIDKSDLEWLLSLYSKNYCRYLNDLDKISIFDDSLQKMIFDKMIDDGEFDSMSPLTIWDLSNSILKKDKKMIVNVLKHINSIDCEPLGLYSTLYKNFKCIMNIQCNPNCKSSDVDMNDKQFYVIKKYNSGYYSKKQLIDILNILSNIEYLWKYDGLDYDQLIDYMICKIIGGTDYE